MLDELRRVQLPPLLTEGNKEAKGPEIDKARVERKWALLMFGGGHFAGMVISLCPRMVSKGKGKEREREPVVVVSKTFHRYTTRRKQGGSQSANDNANGKANSMGAQLRRANEMALREVSTRTGLLMRVEDERRLTRSLWTIGSARVARVVEGRN